MTAQNDRWAALRALRPHQWVKNSLIFAPLLLAHDIADPGRLVATVLGFVSFCALASAAYLVNDILDLEADRLHPRKRNRPFAAGTLQIRTGVVMAVALAVGGLAVSIALVSPLFTVMLGLYLVLTLLYSVYLKERLFLDVLLLAALYTQRVLAGGVAAEVPISPWLLAFSVFFFLSLAFVKRYVELLGAQRDEESALARRAYRVEDLGLVETMGVASGYLSVLVLGLYVSSEDVTRLYSAPTLLWLITPIMLYWISRIWFLARRGSLHDDPVLFAAMDLQSYVCGALVVLVGAISAVTLG
jgi:4-hydroxybenzoate polyprenyltransferase